MCTESGSQLSPSQQQTETTCVQYIPPSLRFSAYDGQSMALWGGTFAMGALWMIQVCACPGTLNANEPCSPG